MRQNNNEFCAIMLIGLNASNIQKKLLDDM